MLKWLLKSVLILAVFVPFAASLPLCSVALSRTPDGAQFFFWAGPWSVSEPELVHETGRSQSHDRSLAGGLQYGAPAQQSGISNAGGICGGNRRGKGLWKSRCGEK